jgi:hypothetical protein
MVRKYRKKPVVIEAMQFVAVADVGQIMAWMGPGAVVFYPNGRDYDGKNATRAVLAIPTLEGEMVANLGDWIIKGVKGEFYPCKPDIFEATYEAVLDHPDTTGLYV